MKTENKKEFLDILEKYQGILHKVNLIYFHNDADREDNFQEMVYQLWNSFLSLKNKESIGSWIYKVAINTSITKLKKDSRFVYNENFPDTVEEDIETGMERSEKSKLLLNAISELNETDKAVMLLYLDGKSYEEISEITGISKSNVGVKINRAKKTLKEKLKFLSDGK